MVASCPRRLLNAKWHYAMTVIVESEPANIVAVKRHKSRCQPRFSKMTIVLSTTYHFIVYGIPESSCPPFLLGRSLPTSNFLTCQKIEAVTLQQRAAARSAATQRLVECLQNSSPGYIPDFCSLKRGGGTKCSPSKGTEQPRPTIAITPSVSCGKSMPSTDAPGYR